MRKYFFSHGRTALKFGLLELGLGCEDEVLLPDFICNELLQPFDQLKIKYKFYSIDDQLNPKWSKLQKKVSDRTKGLLMIHFFGQPQDVKKFKDFCKKNELLLIEDNAHGFGGKFGNILLGTYGDIGFSSPRKVLNIFSGGVLYVKNTLKINVSDIEVFKVRHSQVLKEFFKSILTSDY